MNIPEDEIRFRASRSGGPGGQNVNKRATKVELSFDLAASRALSADQKGRAFRRLRSRLDSRGLLHVTSQTERTQAANRARAVERLTTLVTEAARPYPAPRRATKPSRGSVERRLQAKTQRSQTKRTRQRPGVDD